jgi:hypothetical protein
MISMPWRKKLIQELSKEEGKRQPSPAEWLADQDAKAKGMRSPDEALNSHAPAASEENMTQLRHLALSVEEHDHDDFFWSILETMTDHTGWAEHSSAVHGYRTWKEAWNAGSIEYLRLVKDPRIGPRFRPLHHGSAY